MDLLQMSNVFWLNLESLFSLRGYKGDKYSVCAHHHIKLLAQMFYHSAAEKMCISIYHILRF